MCQTTPKYTVAYGVNSACARFLNVNFQRQDDDDELRIMRDGKARVKKSNVILDSDDDDDDDDIDKINLGKKDTASKPSKSVIKSLKRESSSAPKSELQFSDLVRSQNGDLLFIQLPDHLPGFAAEVKDETPELGNSKPTQSKTQCTLDNLSEGYFGNFILIYSRMADLR